MDRHGNNSGWKQVVLDILTGEPDDYTPPAALQRLIRLAAKHLSADAAFVSTWESEYGLARTAGAYHGVDSEGQKLPRYNDVYDFFGLFGKSPIWFESLKPIVLDPATLPAETVEQQYLQQFGVRLAYIFPLSVSEKVIGALEFWYVRNEPSIADESLQFCNALLPAIITALRHVELYEVENQKRTEAVTLNEVAQILSGSLTLEDIFEKAIEALRYFLTDVYNFSISIIEEGTYLRNQISWKAKDDPLIIGVQERLPIKDTIPSRIALDSGQPFTISNLENMPLLNERVQNLIQAGLRSVLYVPLIYKNEALGLLHINVWNEPRPFTQEEISLSKVVATQVAIAVANSRLFAEKNKQLQLSQTLQKVGALLTASLSLKEVYQQIFDLLAEVVTYDAVSLFLIDSVTGKFAVGDARGVGDVQSIAKLAIQLSPHIMEKIPIPPGWCVIPNVDEHENWLDVPNVPSPKSWIGAALVIKGRLIGVLNVDGKRPYQYDQDQGRTVAVFASQAAIAIENARLYDAILQQTSELSVLHQVALATAGAMELDSLLEQTTEMIVDRLYSEMFGFLLVDNEGEFVYPHHSFHGVPPDLLKIKLPFSGSICGWVAQYKEPTIIPDTREEPLFVTGLIDTRSEVAVPVLIGDECVAVINVESTRPNAFNNQDVYFLTTLARNVAVALEKANLYEELKHQADNLARQVTIQTHSLELERDRMLAILKSVGDGIVFTDTSRTILFVNPAFVALSGFKIEEIEGQQLLQFANAAADRKILNQMWHALKNNRRWSGELVYARKDGTAYDVNISATPSVDKRNRIHGYVIVHADISHFKEVERLKSGFISNISHELRTPLTNINTYLTLLERGRDEKRSAYFATLYQQAEKLNRLIQDLIDISRLDARLSPELVGRTNLFDLLGLFWQRYEGKARQQNLEIRQHYDTDYLIAVPAVKLRFEDADFILTKVIENAFAYTPEGGTIALSIGEQLEDEKSYVWLGLMDSGPGIPAEELDQIFNRFFRGQVARESGIPGTGLGLALAQELLRRQGGWIEVASEVGKGSYFRIYMPSG